MLTKLYRLICDGCGAQTNPYASSKEARAGARKAYGWRRWRQRDEWQDLCPRCQRASRPTYR